MNVDRSNVCDFFDMLGNYKDRVVKNTKDELGKFVLDTALVTDRDYQYETAVAHIDFNNNEWIILEGCDTKEEAEAMHEKWLEKIKAGVDELTDIFLNEVFYHA